MKLKSLLVLVSFACAATVYADGTLTWFSTSSSTNWTDAGNWRDESSAAPAAAPMDGTVPLSFPALPQSGSPYKQVISVGSALSVGDVTEEEPLSFRREFSVSTGPLGFLSAQKYLGYWNWKVTNVNKQQINLVSGAEIEMLIGDSFAQPTVASGLAAISSLGGATVLDKRGSGSLSVGSAAGPGTIVHVEAGSVTLKGRPERLAPAAGAALRVDASDISTMEFEERGDGRRYIARWNDADGRSAYIRKSAYTSSQSWSIPYCTPPFLSPVSANGMPLVDFGAAREVNVGALGPMYCAGQLMRGEGAIGIPGVREIFYVGWITDDMGDNAAFSSGTAYPLYRAGKTLFHRDLANKYVVNGDIYINGRKRAADYTTSAATGDDIASLHVLSVASCVGFNIDLVGTDRYYAGHTGGMRFGEIIVYTNNLTVAERLATHRYLMEKWMPASSDATFCYDAVDVKGSNTGGGVVAVPEGCTASVGQMTLPSAKKLTKTGAGRLEIGSLPQSDATIEIQGGAVAFAGVAPFNDQQPADSPALWLDATAEDSLVPSADERIAKWTDCRSDKSNTVYAVSGTERSARNPYVIRGAQNGHDVVCFGTSSDDRAYSRLYGCTSAYEGFIAIKLYSGSQANVFGSTELAFYRDAKTYLLNPDYAANDGRAARWAVDGIVCNPVRDYTLQSDGTWHVVNFSSLKKLSAGYLVIDKRPGVSTGYGCCEVGEVLYYDRILTAGERRQTEAYLMKRWLSKDHPAKAVTRSVPSLEFSEGVPVVFETDGDMSVANVVAYGSALTKGGLGTVTLDNLSNADSIRSITVDGGTLVTPFAALPDASVFHFDASDANSFETNGESIIKWNDVRRNGVYAQSETPAHGNAAVAYPTLKTAAMGDGNERPYVDFGARNSVWDDSSGGKQTESVQATKAAGMRIYDGSSTVREAHVVYADQTSGSQQHIFTSRNNYHFHRNGAKLLASYTETANARNGYIAIDGTACTSDASLPSGFHLVSMAPAGDTAITTIAADRIYDGRGGSRICEILAFNEALSSADRQFLQDSLMYKWLGVGSKRYAAKELDSLVVRQGARYTNRDSQVSLDVASFAGGGTVDFEKVAISGSLSVGDSGTEAGTAAFTGDLSLGGASGGAGGVAFVCDMLSTNAWDKVLVDGTFVQEGAVALNLNIPNRKALAQGEYPIVMASALSGVDLGEWTVNVPENCKLIIDLYAREGEIGVRIRRPGMVIVVE